MTRDDALTALRALNPNRPDADEEYDHLTADGILLDRLRTLGDSDLADLFEDYRDAWWYA